MLNESKAKDSKFLDSISIEGHLLVVHPRLMLVCFCLYFISFVCRHVNEFPFCLYATSRICNSHYDSHIVFTCALH